MFFILTLSPLHGQDDDNYLFGTSSYKPIRPKKEELAPPPPPPAPVVVKEAPKKEKPKVKPPPPKVMKEKPKKKEIIEYNIAFPTDYPPYSYLDNKNQLVGLYPKFFNVIKDRLGDNIKINFKPMPFVSGMDLAQSGLVGLVGVFKNSSREKIYNFSDALFEEKVTVYVQKGKSFEFANLKDLRGKTLALVKGYSYGNQVDRAKAKKYFNYILTDSDTDSFKVLLSGRVHAILVDDIVANRIIYKLEINDKIEKLKMAAGENSTYLIWAKKLDRADFFKRFNEALTIMQIDKSYSKLVNEFIRSTFSD